MRRFYWNWMDRHDSTQNWSISILHQNTWNCCSKVINNWSFTPELWSPHSSCFPHKVISRLCMMNRGGKFQITWILESRDGYLLWDVRPDEGPHVGDGRTLTRSMAWQTQTTPIGWWQAWQSSGEAWEQSREWIVFSSETGSRSRHADTGIQQQTWEWIVSETWTHAEHTGLLFFHVFTVIKVLAAESV